MFKFIINTIWLEEDDFNIVSFMIDIITFLIEIKVLTNKKYESAGKTIHGNGKIPSTFIHSWLTLTRLNRHRLKQQWNQQEDSCRFNQDWR